MKESFDNALQELKRVDHLFWVSLKYTRTVDVIRNVLQRLINCIDFGLESLLKYSKDKNLVITVPLNPGLKCDLLKKTFPNNLELIDYINFYLKLRKLSKAEYTRREEYRRHVTMIATIDKGEIIEVSIDVLKEYYTKTKSFIDSVRKIINEEMEEKF